jgi:hypothetical protein
MEQIGPAIFKLHSLEVQFRLALTAPNLNMDDLNGLRSKMASQRVQVDTKSSLIWSDSNYVKSVIVWMIYRV